MRVAILFEEMDCVPPKVVQGLQRSIAAAMNAWGVPPKVEIARTEKEQEAYQRFFKWVADNAGNEGPSEG